MVVSGQPAEPFDIGDPAVARAGRLLDALPGFDGLRFNPQVLIQAVNYLHGLGFEGSLRALYALAQPAAGLPLADPDNVLLVARALFVARPGPVALPRLMLGLPDLAEPDDPTLVPLFPLHLHQDLPLLLVGGYMIGGEGLPPSEYLKQCAGLAQLRVAPLHPPDDPLASVDELLASALWSRLNADDWHAGLLRLQALRAVATVVSHTEADEQALFSAGSSAHVWPALRQTVVRRPLRWNPTTQEYEVART